jgi:hypothetical protein
MGSLPGRARFASFFFLAFLYGGKRTKAFGFQTLIHYKESYSGGELSSGSGVEATERVGKLRA